MRNFSTHVAHNQAKLIDFGRSGHQGHVFEHDVKRLRESRLACVSQLLNAFETKSIDRCTPSEEQVLRNFFRWFGACKRGFGWVNYPSWVCTKPSSTIFVYVNLNTGVSVCFIAYVNEGYGETSGLPDSI